MQHKEDQRCKERCKTSDRRRFSWCKTCDRQTSSRCKTKGFQEQGKDARHVVDIIRVQNTRQRKSKCKTKVQANGVQKRARLKASQRQTTRHRIQRCKLKMPVKGTRHRIWQTCKTNFQDIWINNMQDKGALHIRAREGSRQAAKYMIGWQMIWGARHTEISNSTLQEKASIEGTRLISAHEVRTCKVKLQNKSDCVWEGTRQGMQWKCKTKKHDIQADKGTSKLERQDIEAREWKASKGWHWDLELQDNRKRQRCKRK